MAKAYGKPPRSAKLVTDQVLGKSRSDVRWFAPVLQALKPRFVGKKLPFELAARANRSDRICEKWIGGHGAPDGPALARLLNSDVGDIVWKALTQGCVEPWAAKMRKQMLASQLRDQLRAAADQLKLLEGDL
jgi:hypothetical protein